MAADVLRLNIYFKFNFGASYWAFVLKIRHIV
jgi:hypothetical protein